MKRTHLKKRLSLKKLIAEFDIYSALMSYYFNQGARQRPGTDSKYMYRTVIKITLLIHSFPFSCSTQLLLTVYNFLPLYADKTR